jgi:hypothetical protein
LSRNERGRFGALKSTYPSIPLGPSADKDFMAKDEARYTAVYEFDNNVAHSYRNVSHELVTW